MILIGLIQNIALLIALAAVMQIVVSRAHKNVLARAVLTGCLFGIVGVLGMMTPINYAPGIIFDGRSIILAVAGLIGGPLVALISALIIAAYRAWLGGAGAPVGIAVIAASAAIGVVFHYIRRRAGGYLGALPLFGFGLLVHIVMLAIFILLPDRIGLQFIRTMGIAIILSYPTTTMLVCLLFQDYEEKEKTRASIERLAYYDTLTGLPNRTLLIDKLNRTLSAYKQIEYTGALILINLDRFKTLNDARGHATGDILLRAVASRLSMLLGEDDTLARMSADEFAILLQHTGQDTSTIPEFARAMADKVHISLKFPLHVATDEIAIATSIGVAMFPHNPDDTASDVLRRANTAMHRAKQNGGNQSVFFEQSMTSAVEQRFRIERELRSAINAGELRLYLQSQVTASGAIVGAEALIRWQHPERGLIPPASFIPVAEETDLIAEVGHWVMTEACKILARDEMLGRPLRLSINVSPRHFRQSGFVTETKRILADTGADPSHLTLEITEGLLIDNVNDVIAKMIELTTLGIHFSVDDFGTGYSSLSYLKRLPIDELKIDKTFVQDAPTNPDDAALVESILAIAKHMQLDIVAEGVETQEQADFLTRRADIIYQGYLFGKPEPSDQWLQHLP
jgi:diguanylate cyclase (GGDEF)-like protein